MGETYENKKFNTIKQDIRKEFKNIENNKKGRYRDDQEIYDAGINVISNYIKELSNADGMRISNEKWGVKEGKAVLLKSANLYKGEALKYFKDARDSFSKRRKEVLDERGVFGMYITTSSQNEKQIHEIAKAINTAEEIALKKIEKVCNPKQEQSNAVEDSEIVRDNEGKVKINNGEIVRQKPLFNQSNDGTITFTDRANPLKINQALGNLFKNKYKVYKINYSKCTNPNIKTKIQNTVGGLSCRIKYDKNLQTYVLTDKNGNILSERAIVWDGVMLKQDTIIEGQADENGGLTYGESKSLENLRSNSNQFEFDANNYKYYEQYRQKHKRDICSSYAYGVVSDILSKQGYCFSASEVSAWEIASSSYLKGKFNVDVIDRNNPKQQIIDAPAGTFFTVKYDKTSHQSHGVSHVMVSLGNGVYTDLFGTYIRKIDFKSDVKFSGNKFLYRGKYYTITEDSRLLSPNINNLSEGKEQILDGKNISPDDFASQICKSTGANINYIKSLIASQNNILESEFSSPVDKLSVKIITKQITKLELNNKEGSNSIANGFLESIKDNKEDIMEHYPKLTNHEYDEIAKRAMGILYQESNSGTKASYYAKSIFHFGRNIINGGEENGNWSRGYTQIKFNQVFNKDSVAFLNEFEIRNGNDLTDYRKCGVATMVALIDKYYDIILPMKSDPFRRNDAQIINLTFKNKDLKFKDVARLKLKPKNIQDSIAIGKVLKINGEKRARTKDEIDDLIKKWKVENGGIDKKEIITRKGITNDDDFFDFLYYAWNKPSEIYYGTAIPSKNNYIAQSKKYISEHTNEETHNA